MSDPVLGPIVITAREVYDAMLRIQGQLANVQIQMTQHTEYHKERDAEERSFRKDHEDRIRSMEKGRWPLPSLAVLVALAALIVPFVVKS